MNDRCSASIRNLIASPPWPHPWQKKTLRAGETVNDGVFSSWNGHRPLRLPPPADRSVTVSLITSAIDVRSRTSAMSSSRTLATGTSCLASGVVRQQGPVPRQRGRVGERGHLVDHHAEPRRVVTGRLPHRGEQRVELLGRPPAQRLDQLHQDLALLVVPVVG